MRKSILLAASLLAFAAQAQKQVIITNMSYYTLVVEYITVQDYFGFVGMTSTGPHPVEFGYNVGSPTSYTLPNSNYIVVGNSYSPNNVVDLSHYTNGSYTSYPSPMGPFGAFPFGWASTLNPFYNKVFPYVTNASGVDVPSSSVAVSLPVHDNNELCIKGIRISFLQEDSMNPGHYDVIGRIEHSASDLAKKSAYSFDMNNILLSEYRHRVLTNWISTSSCVADQITINAM